MSRRLILANYGLGGDIEIDTTYAIYYTSSDGNVITPYRTNFGSAIVTNIYVNGQGIISFNGPVTTIGYSAFYICTSLKSITIPDSVTSIGDKAFYVCYNLTSVYCKATTPPALGTFVFAGNHSDLKIYVPTESVDAYKSATRWNEYADAIVGYNFEESGEENGGNLITFTIDDVEYQAEQGMTWAVWCESSYNTDGFIYAWGDASLVIYASGYERYVNIGTSADPSTVKITNTSYTTKAVNWPR